MVLPRELEPESMDSFDDAHAYDAMDHAAVNDQFVRDLLDAVPEPLGAVLDLGTGTAQIPVRLCQQERTCRVMAVDRSIAMLELARYNVEVGGVRDRVQLAHVDARQLPYAEPMFDVTMSNSLVHHLDDPLPALRKAVRVTRPGGRLFFRDLLRPDSEADVMQLVEQYAAGEDERARELFRASLHAALRLDELAALIGQLDVEQSELEATSDRHWTWTAIRP